MRRAGILALAAGIALLGWGVFSPDPALGNEAAITKVQPPEQLPTRTPTKAVEDGLAWLVSVQGANGGWGQDGGETSHVRVGESLESNGNDVANTAVAVMALVKGGHEPGEGKYGKAIDRGLEFILGHVEKSADEGLAVTNVRDTQIQRKLGPYIDTFLTSMLLGELDGRMDDAKANDRVRAALEKCVGKIEANQLEDGSWNLSGGWAPILGTSLASKSLYLAEKKGIAVDGEVLLRVNEYTEVAAAQTASGGGSGSLVGGGSGGGVGGGVYRVADAGVDLYRDAQILEQLSRTEEAREQNADEIDEIKAKLSNRRFVEGFGSIGGEEFFSYLNVGDSLKREGGEAWEKWNAQTTTKIVRLQNQDGSWAGHHCITGRVAVTSAAVLNLLAGV